MALSACGSPAPPATGASTADQSLSPGDRIAAAVTYDPRLRRIILFGGVQAACATERQATWLFDGHDWVASLAADAPTPLHDSAMAYDPELNRVVYVGYAGGGGGFQTWSFDGTRWQVVSPLRNPPGIGNASGGPNGARDLALVMSYDTALRALLLWQPRYSGDDHLWLLSGDSWRQTRVPPMLASGFEALGMSYDPVLRADILAGLAAEGSVFQTWKFSGASWAEVSAAGPSPRIPVPEVDAWRAGMVFDPQTGDILLVKAPYPNFVDPSNDRAEQTWLFGGGGWRRVNTSGSVPARSYESLAYDPSMHSVLLYGGASSTLPVLAYGDTWSLTDNKWILLSRGPAPTAPNANRSC